MVCSIQQRCDMFMQNVEHFWNDSVQFSEHPNSHLQLKCSNVGSEAVKIRPSCGIPQGDNTWACLISNRDTKWLLYSVWLLFMLRNREVYVFDKLQNIPISESHKGYLYIIR